MVMAQGAVALLHSTEEEEVDILREVGMVLEEATGHLQGVGMDRRLVVAMDPGLDLEADQWDLTEVAHRICVAVHHRAGTEASKVEEEWDLEVR